MLVIYVGDASNIIKRILNDHCGGSNVEASALRRHVAEAMGFGINRTKRASGSWRVRIDLPNPRIGEAIVSKYIQSGSWRFITCASYEEAHGFQWYVIDQLNPILNKDRKSWNPENLSRYVELFNELLSATRFSCDELKGMKSRAGVYVFYHMHKPSHDILASDIKF